jgi:copper(I)-binding protein
MLMSQAWAGPNEVIVDKVWMRESVPGQTSATLQLNIFSPKPVLLLSVRSPLASGGEIQVVKLHHGKMQARVLPSMKIAPHRTFSFGLHGQYLVLTGLSQRLNVDDRVPVSLSIKVAGKQQTINIEAEVRPLELSYQHYKDPTVKDHR